MRVSGWQTRARNESERRWEGSAKGPAPSTDLEIRLIGLSKSISVGTRKMVNYDWLG
jgi:hypothetical protein